MQRSVVGSNKHSCSRSWLYQVAPCEDSYARAEQGKQNFRLPSHKTVARRPVFLTRVLEPLACEGFVICYAGEARERSEEADNNLLTEKLEAGREAPVIRTIKSLSVTPSAPQPPDHNAH